jgi:quercetin dioxygenase-like cupin family protein
MPDDTDLLAAEYVIGVLDQTERAALASRLPGDDALRGAVAAWEARLVPLLESAPQTPPPADLWSRIEAALPPPVVSVRGDNADWQSRLPGIEKKLLHFDPETGRERFLLRLAPGARIPPHTHPRDEEMYVLEGEVTVGGAQLKTGDFQIGPAGSDHVEIIAPAGALLYISGGLGPAVAVR